MANDSLRETYGTGLDAVLAGLWFGLIMGVLESATYWMFHRLQNPDAPWLCVFVDLSLGFIAGALGSAAQLLAPRFPAKKAVTWFFCILIPLNTVSTAPERVGSNGFFLNKTIIFLMVIGPLVAGVFFIWLCSKYWEGIRRLQKKSTPWLATIVLAYAFAFPVTQMARERTALKNLPPAAKNAPNVVVVVIDTLRADHLSTYGYQRETSPNLTHLASQGVLLEQAIAPAPATLPSHASMLTGLYPGEHDADGLDKAIGRQFPVLGDAFAQRGYRTAAFSGNFGVFCRYYGFSRGFIHFEDFGSYLRSALHTNVFIRIHTILFHTGLWRDLNGRQDAASINRRALSWIDSDSRPFFVFLNYFDAHQPYLPPRECYQRFSKRSSPPGGLSYDSDGTRKTSPLDAQDQMDAYDASIACADVQLGKLWQALESRGLDKNTILLVTADHGEAFLEHGLMSHDNSLYYELIHVPLIIVAPGRIPPNVRIPTMVSLTQMPATLLDLSSHSSSNFRGPSMAVLWSGAPVSMWPNPISQLAAQRSMPEFLNYKQPLESLITPQWHLILGGTRGSELFKCCSDDRRNLWNTDEGKKALSELERDPEILSFGYHIVQNGGSEVTVVKTMKTGSAANLQGGADREVLHSLGYAN